MNRQLVSAASNKLAITGSTTFLMTPGAKKVTTPLSLSYSTHIDVYMTSGVLEFLVVLTHFVQKTLVQSRRACERYYCIAAIFFFMKLNPESLGLLFLEVALTLFTNLVLRG